MEHEPLANVSADDIHIIAGSADTGQLLCYLVIKAVTAPPEVTFRTRERPLFPVEQVFGWGVYHRLNVVPDLPLSSIRELGRFVKNQQLSPTSELAIRAPAEVVVVILRLLSGSLGDVVTACIGDIEEGVVTNNLDLFHIPTAVVHGVIPCTSEDALVGMGYAIGTRYPFAFLCSDISLTRLAAIEAALVRVGKHGVRALLALRRDKHILPSSLMPLEGLPALTDIAVPQKGIDMRVRRHFLDRGAWLRTTDHFSCLSPAEAAVLGTLLEQRSVAAGEVMVRQGECDSALYLIEAGSADVYATSHSGCRAKVNTIGVGASFGEITLITNGEQTADVIARTPMVLLRLNRAVYTRYLAHLAEVEQRFIRAALECSHTIWQAMAPGAPATHPHQSSNTVGVHTTHCYCAKHIFGAAR
jgi:hypothetical protein